MTAPNIAFPDEPGHQQREISNQLYSGFVNPEWVHLLSVLGLDRRFISASGSELKTDSGERILDFLSGYGVYNAGHNHPAIAAALIEEISSGRPSMLQSHVPELAGTLAKRLCDLAGGKVEKVYFGSTGSEGVESAIKFSRKFTKRDGILYAEGGFHGLTCGALSLMSNMWWRDGFGPLLPATQGIPFGDVDALTRELASKKYAALIIEPIQGESGVAIPPEGYLKEAQRLCEKYGTVFVIDEVQTGLHRTGPFIASHHFGIEPDIVILAKALSGGFVPVSAMLMRTDICRSVYSSADKAFVHASTFSENSLAMRAGLATLDVMANERLGDRSIKLGEILRAKLRERLGRFSFIREVRGLGLFNAIEFRSPSKISLRLMYSGFRRLHPGLFGQMVVKSLFERSQILCQMAGNNFMAIKSLPALTISEDQITHYVDALEDLCKTIDSGDASFWTQGMKIGARALRKAR